MPIKKRAVIAALFTLVFFSSSLFATNSRPNIVLIVSDNQSHSLIGTYGNAEIKTPNIDRLAEHGVQFNQAFSVNGVCSPTRATLLTGLMPSQTGIHVALPSDINVPNWSGIEEFRNIPQTFSEAGYNTALVGKYHLGMPQKPQIGFQYWVTFPSGHTTTFYDQTVIDNGKQYEVAEHLTDFWTKKAVEYLSQQKKDKPFFLYLAYNGPYNLPPTVTMEPRNRHADYYKNHTPSMPQESVHPYLKNWAQGLRGPSNLMLKEGTTAWKAIEALNNKTAMINAASETTMVDDGVGTIMETLKKLGIDDNTIVIYTSDQGASYGHNGLFGNTSWSFPFTAHNINMQIPLILSHPGKIKAGVKSDKIINQYDLFPTLLEYAGMKDKTIANSPGKSFMPFLQGNSIKNWDDAAFFEFVTVRVIRTSKWKYMKRLDDEEEPNTLYDLNNDPDEKINLIDDPAYAKTRDSLDKRLTAFFTKYSDSKYDVWNGGSAKGILLEKYYGRDDIFKSRFPNWKEPTLEKAKHVFTDIK
ncbi:MAG: sulfatase-like hydrolase/transferase [Gammaproteobacteria bacterium]|jgi:arylsulfatase A-like enzyme|nr:sulfatase-like hydrolase/transferase [Gammaproteobacteria bacterium]